MHCQRAGYTSITSLRESVSGYPRMQCIRVPSVPSGRYSRRVKHADNNLGSQAHEQCTLNRDSSKIHCICQEDPVHMSAHDVHFFVSGAFGRAFSKGWLHQCNPFERRCTQVPTNVVHSCSIGARWTLQQEVRVRHAGRMHAKLMTAPTNAWQSCAYSVIILNAVTFSERGDPKPNFIFVRILTLYHCLYMSILKI